MCAKLFGLLAIKITFPFVINWLEQPYYNGKVIFCITNTAHPHSGWFIFRTLCELNRVTSEGSACGRACASYIVRAYKNAGYTGIIITDHFFYGNTAVDRKLPWNEWVESFCKGYENAYEEGKKAGLQVFFG